VSTRSSSGGESRSPAGARILQPRILVVDDEDGYVHAAIRGALHSLQANIVRAGSAAEGLDLARSHRPHLAIIATGLPDADGYELARSFRVEPGLERLRILIITGYFFSAQSAHDTVVDEILGKPFRLHEFLNVVERLLKRGVPLG
jgi:CheY-like chemotaxis protein